MTPRELFGMLLKVLGIWLIISALGNVPFGTYYLMRGGNNVTRLGAFMYVFAPAAIHFICACFLVFYTDWFVKLFVPPQHTVVARITARNLFGALARTLGVWQLALALGELPGAIHSARGYNDDREFVEMILSSFLNPGIHAVVGLFLLFGTSWVVRASYRNSQTIAPASDGPPLPAQDEHGQGEDGEDER